MVDLFVKMEKELPVEKYTLCDVKVWPYIRLSLKNKLDSHFLINKGKSKHIRQKSAWHRMKNAFITLLSFVKLVSFAIFKFPKRVFTSDETVDYLMFCFNSEYMAYGKREINRNLLPIVDALQNDLSQPSFEIWEYTSVNDIKRKNNFPGFNITPLSAALNEWCRFRICWAELFPKREIDFVSDINRFLAQKNLPVKLESHKLLSEVQRIVTFSRLVRHYIRRCKVKKVINICYYSYVGMAVNLACFRENIPALEYQHGVQTDYHPLYSHWTNVPDSGYELLPEYFWVWGEVTRQVISDWVVTQKFHKVQIVGNAWLNYFEREISGALTLSAEQRLRYQDKVIILVSLQAFPEHFKHHVIEAMKSSEPGWIWVLKEHPRYALSDDIQKSYFAELISQGTVVVERDFSIYELLTLLPIAVHLTAYSTVAFECEHFGVPTVFFHENGVNGNKALIARCNHLFAGLDADTLLRAIHSALAIKQVEPAFMSSKISICQRLLNDSV